MSRIENETTPNFTGYDFHNHEWWLEYGGSTVWSDAIGVFIMPVIVSLGVILNLTGFLVLQFSSTFAQAKIYTYLKFNFLNGFLCTSTGVLYSFTVVRRYTPFADSWFALWYMNAIGLPIANVCYYYNSMIDILITFEKLSIFVKRLELFNKKYFNRPQTICIAVFLVCLTIDFPYFFFYEPSAQIIYFSPNESYEFVNYQISQFTQSEVGQVTLYVQYALRDIIPLIFLVSFNVKLVLELKKYMAKKSNMTQATTAANNAMVAEEGRTVANRTQSTNLEGQKKKKLVSIAPAAINAVSAKQKKMQRSQVSTSIMVILICVFSFAKSAIILISIVYSSIQQGLVANLLGTFSDYVIYTCTTLNFFIIFQFDRNFNEFFTKQNWTNWSRQARRRSSSQVFVSTSVAREC